VAGAVVVLAGIAGPVPAAVHQPEERAPRALHGRFAGSDRVAVRVFALPDPATARVAGTGRRQRLFELPRSAVHVSGARYSVAVPPGRLPASVVSPGGLVTLHVVAHDLRSGRVGAASASVREDPVPGRGARAGGSGRWSDVRLDVPLVRARRPAGPVGAARAMSPTTTTRTATILWGARRNVWATIGSGYPTSRQTSWMRFVSTRSQEFTTTLGVAMAYNGAGFNYSQRGTRSLDRSFGFHWDRSRAQRLYQVGVTYRHALIDLGPNPSNLRYLSEWVPVRYNGGTHDVRGVHRPDWGHCARQSRGDWYRNLASGRAYQNSAGVHLPFARISLSTRRGYNREAQLGYHNLRGQRLCGNNADPAHAGAVMQRKR
jgi:hypothetical protein